MHRSIDLVHDFKKRIKWKVDFYDSKEWRKLSRYIYKRDKLLCQGCLNGLVVDGIQILEPRGRITPLDEKRSRIAHHIVELQHPSSPNAYLNLEPSNIILLCHECHNRVHNRQWHKESKFNKEKEMRDLLNATDVVDFETLKEVMWDD